MIIRHGWDNASISDCASAGFQIHTFTFLILSFIFFLALKKINHFKESLKIIPYTLEFLDKENSVFLPLKWQHILLFYTQLKLARFKILKLCMEWNCKQWNLCMGPVGSYTGFCWSCCWELHPKNKCSLKTSSGPQIRQYDLSYVFLYIDMPVSHCMLKLIWRQTTSLFPLFPPPIFLKICQKYTADYTWVILYIQPVNHWPCRTGLPIM